MIDIHSQRGYRQASAKGWAISGRSTRQPIMKHRIQRQSIIVNIRYREKHSRVDIPLQVNHSVFFFHASQSHACHFAHITLHTYAAQYQRTSATPAQVAIPFMTGISNTASSFNLMVLFQSISKSCKKENIKIYIELMYKIKICQIGKRVRRLVLSLLHLFVVGVVVEPFPPAGAVCPDQLLWRLLLPHRLGFVYSPFSCRFFCRRIFELLIHQARAVCPDRLPRRLLLSLGREVI